MESNNLLTNYYERRFKIDSLPLGCSRFDSYDIKQTSINESTQIIKKDDKYFIIVNEEGKKITMDVNSTSLDTMEFTDIKVYLIPLSARLTAELKVYKNNLYIISVKFKNLEDYNNFTKPNYFGHEITNEEIFSEHNIYLDLVKKVKTKEKV